MFDSAEIRIHPTGKAIARFGTKSQGQGHETTYAQIIAEELGLPADDVQVEEGDTDTAPYGLGTYASRSTPTAGAAGAMAARKIKAKAKKIAAHLLEVAEDDLEWNVDRFQVKGSPDQAKTIQEIAFAAYTNHPPGMEAGLEAIDYYDPPNLTFPFGSYICVVDIDKGTGEVKIRRFVAVDDCGNIINPLIVEGQIHGGLTMGLAPALLRGDRLRRERPEPDRHLLRLPAADRGRDAEVGAGQDHHAVAAPPARAPRASASRRPSARRRRSPTRWSTRSGTSACATSTSRSRRPRCGSCCATRGSPSNGVFDDYFALAHRLQSEGRPFATAAVVRAEKPTSARPGDRAIVTTDGTLHGWIGGSCAQPTVVQAALAAIADGRPRLVRLSPDPGAHPAPAGYEELPMTCFSGGTLDVYVEPQHPQPRLVIVGDLPVAQALARLGRAMSWRVLAVTGEGSAEAMAEADEVRNDLAAIADWATPWTAIVIATHGHFDEPAAAAALRTPAPYVALVASRKRAAEVAAHLDAEGLTEERKRLRAPAGLDIGARRGDEIALSIVAEIVQERRRAERAASAAAAEPASPGSPAAGSAAPASGEAPGTAVDPVCGMKVTVTATTAVVDHGGERHHFCCPGCAARFTREPERYLGSTPAGR